MKVKIKTCIFLCQFDLHQFFITYLAIFYIVKIKGADYG